MEKLIERILRAAKNHGAESDPDHEVGDLQDALREFGRHINSAHHHVIEAQLDSILCWDPVGGDYVDVDDCIETGSHLTATTGDGHCKYCGEKGGPDDQAA